jgi:hypothetical protein
MTKGECLGLVAACKAATKPSFTVISNVAGNSNLTVKSLMQRRNLSKYLRLIFLLSNQGKKKPNFS